MSGFHTPIGVVEEKLVAGGEETLLDIAERSGSGVCEWGREVVSST